jgi:hypothetical protein
MVWKVLKKKDLRKLALINGINYPELYVEFMKKRFPHERDNTYAKEWVERFRTGDPTAFMDNQSIKAYIDSIKKLRKVM